MASRPITYGSSGPFPTYQHAAPTYANQPQRHPQQFGSSVAYPSYNLYAGNSQVYPVYNTAHYRPFGQGDQTGLGTYASGSNRYQTNLQFGQQPQGASSQFDRMDTVKQSDVPSKKSSRI